MRRKFSLGLLLVFSLQLLLAQQQVDVFIIGGGAGGTSAAIQAARMGSSVIILEKSPWLGGMLTSAGVSAIDGNHELPSGIWGEFRDALYTHYGGPKAVATGWVSHTLFEPSVADRLLKKMANLRNLKIAYNSKYYTITELDDGWILVWDNNGERQVTQTKILIDATETGELLPVLGAKFRLGMDSKEETGEQEAPEVANPIVQDLTYVAILTDVGDTKSKEGLVKKPKGYDPAQFKCSCKRPEGEMFGGVSSCEQMLNYGKLPNNKYMINWPNCGNDYYVDWGRLSDEEREKEIKKAKAHTLKFVYYIQNDLGYKNLRLAPEFPTEDNLPFIPYDREGRRVEGKVFLTVDHLERPYDFNLYKTGVAVGDYPIDHHHDKNPDTPKIEFINIKVPSYNIPMGVLIPDNVNNFIVAEKNISVSNIVNGTTRLQPVVLGIGQAAGALAAMAAREAKTPSDVEVRKVQRALLEAKAYIMPFIDVDKDDRAFTAIQKIGATGVFNGYGIPYKWANQTWFYPAQIVSEYEWIQGLTPFVPKLSQIPASGKPITLKFVKEVIRQTQPQFQVMEINQNWNTWGIDQELNEDAALNRRTMSLLTNQIFDPFNIPVDLKGNTISN
ncbi:FAD-dependent oxidoreductase [Muriicola sp. Z0-33]|uniref:FAD-dependent oxidoreductase n=1 Tax=Muriicola sp. Z0-33 TaxID=2816957 RepID=UPI0022370B24|nr:FAD-dependent oxidoreductase [Muriicola sp. Z0-33]MCW5516959.1 FAD-dependent oxidoreductase [Muriicola sp. Z0-33]